jgi:hypothetical protein
VYLDGQRPFLRAEGTSAIAQLIAGQHSSLSTGDATNPRQDASRSLKIVVDLPANHLGPGRRNYA